MSWRGRLRDALWWGMERLDRVIGDEAAPVQSGSAQAGEPEDLGQPLPSSAPPVLTEEAAKMLAPTPRPEQSVKPKPLEGTREATLEARMEQARRRLR